MGLIGTHLPVAKYGCICYAASVNVRCPPWLWFVVLRADRSLQFSSRPPSSRAFLVGYRKVYSVRCEADVVMTLVTSFLQVARDTNRGLPESRRRRAFLPP